MTTTHLQKGALMGIRKLGDLDLRGPACVFVTVSRTGSTRVVLASDHTVTDGHSMASVPHKLTDLYTAAIRGVAPQLGSAYGHLDYAESGWARQTGLTANHPAIGDRRELIAAHASQLPDFNIAIGAPKSAAQRNGRIRLFDSATARKVDRACRPKGGNTVADVFARLAFARKAPANQSQFNTVAPFHTRHDPRWRGSVGWYVGLSPVSFPVSDPFPELLRTARFELKRAKETARLPCSKAVELHGTPLRNRLIVTNLDHRRVPGSQCRARWRTRFLISRSADPYEGICMSFRHPGTALARTAVDGYLNEVSLADYRISAAAEESGGGRLTLAGHQSL
ncbi:MULTISPECIES: condensation domain-containing protein [unclassified Sinorhizobium]|uniref:condensation domain-containing protein n=1 Tax=unclassified Sinorhizobium TaxID=2613772 RepID=UPI0024C2B545|nr:MULTISPECIES: condensation domain-containing protein [unclassified Sinorhizobium]MDK1378111.1 hypothetical protein [Sinorhizobium sp. 6-70]MDK1481734.1 hypothetical protein [Sinorhizobium sp. 6-117]